MEKKIRELLQQIYNEDRYNYIEENYPNLIEDIENEILKLKEKENNYSDYKMIWYINQLFIRNKVII